VVTLVFTEIVCSTLEPRPPTLEHQRSNTGTKIEFVTTGVVLAMLQNGIQSLSNISHLLIDEVHERGVEVDYLLTVRGVRAHLNIITP
jgi:HrpA-like RNA helicase